MGGREDRLVPKRRTMPVVQHAHKEIHLKLVYYGPGLGGKTTNLEHIHAKSRPEYRGKLLSLSTEAERTLFFDLLPVDLGTFRGYTIRLHLCTVPGQIRYNETRKLVLRHVDAIVFVVDSQPGALDANIESIKNLETNLLLQGDDPQTIPLVVQYNKRDLPGVLPLDVLRLALCVPAGVPELEASARFGVGVSETLKQTVRACLGLIQDPSKVPEGRTPSVLPGRRASMFPGGAPPVSSRRDPNAPIPLAPRVPELAEGSGEDRQALAPR
jgi:signal recognition particle receptor subunit beta